MTGEPSEEDFIQAAEDALAELPAWVRDALENIAFVVEPFPDREVQREMGLESPYDLLGLYQGTPISERGGSYGYGNLPDLIHLYRRPILAFCAVEGIDWRHGVRHVVVHEIGHYLGLSDEEMEAMEKGEDQERS